MRHLVSLYASGLTRRNCRFCEAIQVMMFPAEYWLMLLRFVDYLFRTDSRYFSENQDNNATVVVLYRLS